MKRLLLLAFLATTAFGRGAYTGWCERGGGTVTIQGNSATPRFQTSYPSCTVTVRDSGGSIASIYSDNSGTVLANPFTANSASATSPALFSFFADQGNYTVTLSGGTIPAPFSMNVTIAANSGGITSLNALTGATQTFATGTSGTNFTISSSGTTHTFNLPTASASNRGLLSTTDWSAFNAKQSALTFTSPLVNTAGTVALTLPITIARGGTGQITQTLGFNALSPQTTKGDLIAHNGTNAIRLAVGSNGTVLTADSGQASGWIWSTPTNYWTLSGANIYNNAATSACPGGTADACFARNASGVVEVNSGTGGTFRDLKLRSLYMTEFTQWTKISTPASAASGTLNVFANTTTNRLDCINSAGTSCMPAGVNGSNVASAATMTLGVGNVFHITGTTNITTMNTCDSTTAGLTVTLIFDGVLTLTDGNNLKLAGNFVTTADDTATLVCDSSNWIEVARSVN